MYREVVTVVPCCAAEQAYGMVPKHGSYGAEAIQALVDNITLPEFRGNLIIILGGYHDSIEQLFESNAGFRSRFDKRRIEFPSWTAEMAAKATIKQIAKDGLSITAEAQELLPHMYQQLVSLPEWGSARDVYRNILPAMYSKRSKRLAAIARVEKIESEAAAGSSGGLSVDVDDVGSADSRHARRLKRPHSSATSPYTAMDVRDAFAGSIKSRGTQGLSSASSPKKTQRPSWPSQPGGSGGPSHVSFNSPDGLAPPIVKRKQTIMTRVRREDDDLSGKGGWDAAAVSAALEEACAELGYSLDRIEEILTGGKYPSELLALVSSKSGCADLAVLVDILDSQKAVFLAKVIEIKRKMAAGQAAADKKTQEKIRQIGKCPMNFDWLKIPGGYQCSGGTHFVSDAELGM